MIPILFKLFLESFAFEMTEVLEVVLLLFKKFAFSWTQMSWHMMLWFNSTVLNGIRINDWKLFWRWLFVHHFLQNLISYFMEWQFCKIEFLKCVSNKQSWLLLLRGWEFYKWNRWGLFLQWYDFLNDNHSSWLGTRKEGVDHDEWIW